MIIGGVGDVDQVEYATWRLGWLSGCSFCVVVLAETGLEAGMKMLVEAGDTQGMCCVARRRSSRNSTRTVSSKNESESLEEASW